MINLKKYLRGALILLASILFFVVFVPSALAQAPSPTPIPILTFWGEAQCVVDGVATLDCIPAVIKLIINAALLFAGVVALILIIHSGFKFVTSSGDPKKVEEARETMTYAITGLIIVLLAFFIINLISHITRVNCIKFIGFVCL